MPNDLMTAMPVAVEGGDRFTPESVPMPLRGVRCRVLRPARTRDEMEHEAEQLEYGFKPPTPDPSEVHEFFTLCGPGIPRHDEPTEDAPALILRWLDNVQGTGSRFHYAEPPCPPDDGPGHYTAGRNFLTTFGHSLAVLYRPAAIFDRFERPFRPR